MSARKIKQEADRNIEISEDQLNIAISSFNKELYSFYVEPIRHTTIQEADL